MSPITLISHCSDKGKEIELSSTESSPNLFTADNAKFVHHFNYRGVACFVLVSYTGGGVKKFWTKLLRYIREEKKREDDMWEHGVDESVWERQRA